VLALAEKFTKEELTAGPEWTSLISIPSLLKELKTLAGKYGIQTLQPQSVQTTSFKELSSKEKLASLEPNREMLLKEL